MSTVAKIAEVCHTMVTTSAADGLAWDPEPYTCQEGTEQALCDVFDPALELFINAVYCGKKFPEEGFSPTAYNADPLCGVDDEDEECSAIPEVKSRAAAGGDRSHVRRGKSCPP